MAKQNGFQARVTYANKDHVRDTIFPTGSKLQRDKESSRWQALYRVWLHTVVATGTTAYPHTSQAIRTDS